MIAGRKWLKAIALGMVGAVMVTATAAAQETAEVRTKREEAVAIARKGDLQLAAQSLADLFDETHEEMVEYDYLTILNWKGNHEQTVKLYEAYPVPQAPNYVLRNVASAYYRLRNYEKALEIIEPIMHDDLDAKLLTAKIYVAMNKSPKALAIFNAMEEQDPENILIYKAKGDCFMEAGDCNVAAVAWEKALELYHKAPIAEVTEERLADNYSACLIRVGRYKDAEAFLKPYVVADKANDNMYGNYLTSINRQKRYKEIPALFAKRFKDLSKAPVYALRELADCYEKRLYCEKATDIFRLVLKSPDRILDDRFKFAYNAAMTHKYREEGLAMYKALLADTEGAAFTQRVLDNAHEYLMKGKIAAAKGVYGLLAEHDKRFYKIYADDFFDAGFNLHALHEYKIMTADKDLAKAGKEGMVKAYVAENDYREAGKLFSELKEKYPEEGDISAAAGYWINKYVGELNVEASNNNDKGDNNTIEAKVTAEQWLGDSLWVKAGYGYQHVKDNVNNLYSDSDELRDNFKSREHIHTESAGLMHKSGKFVTEVGLNNYQVADQCIKPEFKETWKPTDRQKLTVNYGENPVLGVRAYRFDKLKSEYDNDSFQRYLNSSYRKKVYGREVSLDYEYDLNQLEKYYFHYNFRENNDGVHKHGFGIEQYKLIYEKKALEKTLERRLHYSRSINSAQTDFETDVDMGPLGYHYVGGSRYNSPKFNENFGAEWRWGKAAFSYGRIYHIWGVDWDRDYPERLGLSPYYRFEFVQDIDNNHEFMVATTHRFKSGDWHGGRRFKYDDAVFEVQYRISW